MAIGGKLAEIMEIIETMPTRLVMHFAYMAHYGLQEIPGVDNNPTIMSWFRILGQTWVQGDETAWCCAMHNALARINGIEHTMALDARSLLNIGENIPLEEAKLGHTVIYWREDRNGWKGHVGLIANKDIERGLIYTHGGNQSNMVNCAPYPIDGDNYGLLAIKELKYL